MIKLPTTITLASLAFALAACALGEATTIDGEGGGPCDSHNEGGAAGGETSHGGAGGIGGTAPTCDPFPETCESDADCGGLDCGACGNWTGAMGPMTCIACPGPAECDG